jgi:hypothetical protein
MPDLEAWLANDVVRPSERAAMAWRRINDRPTSITIRRGGVTLAAQTVRIEWSGYAREDEDIEVAVDAMPGVGRLTVFGVRGHPTVPDTDIERGDRFIIGAAEVEVIVLLLPPGEVQAVCEART